MIYDVYNKPTKAYVLILLVLGFSAARFFMPSHPVSPHGTYEAFAHLLVGGLIGAWLVTMQKLYGFLALVFSLVEVAAFFALKK